VVGTFTTSVAALLVTALVTLDALATFDTLAALASDADETVTSAAAKRAALSILNY
jgi:hypothetical protein